MRLPALLDRGRDTVLGGKLRGLAGLLSRLLFYLMWLLPPRMRHIPMQPPRLHFEGCLCAVRCRSMTHASVFGRCLQSGCVAVSAESTAAFMRSLLLGANPDQVSASEVLLQAIEALGAECVVQGKTLTTYTCAKPACRSHPGAVTSEELPL